jgi:hypothetical protein
MKETSSPKRRLAQRDDLRPEYAFDYKKARLNRFAGRASKERTIVVLDPDVSQVFKTPESVNKALRAIISAMPRTKPKAIRESSQK